MYVRRLPIAKIAIIVIGIFFTTAASTFVFAQQNKPLPKKVIVKHTNQDKTPTASKSASPSPAKLAKTLRPSPTPTPTKILSPTTATENTKSSIGGAQPQSSQTSPTSPATPSTPTTAPTMTTPPSSNTGTIIDQVNSYRASQGLTPVQTSGETCAFAATRALEITSNFSHDAFNSRISSNTLPYGSWSAVTENIAQTSNPQNVVPMWINSPGHAANMRADTPYVCIQQNGDYYAYEGMKP